MCRWSWSEEARSYYRFSRRLLPCSPAPIPYLHADPEKVAEWRNFFKEVTALKVGIVWAGDPRHKGDRQRSIAADAVLPRFVMPGVQLYGLQKEPLAADIPRNRLVLSDRRHMDNTQTVSKWGDLLGRRNRVKSKTYALPYYFALEDNLLLGS